MELVIFTIQAPVIVELQVLVQGLGVDFTFAWNNINNNNNNKNKNDKNSTRG